MMRKNYFTLNIIPLISLPPNSPDFFTYFTEEALKPFSLVEINFKNKITQGIVVEIFKGAWRRKELKEILPKLKKINRVLVPEEVILSSDFALLRWLSNFFGFSWPFIIKNFFSPLIKHELKNFFLKTSFKNKTLWAKDLKEVNLKNKKILVVVPETSFIIEARNYFQQNSSLPVYHLLPPLSQTKIEKLKKILKAEELVLVIPKKLVFNLVDFFHTLIIYRQGSFFYYDAFHNVNFDYREIFKKLAVLKKRELIFLDSLPTLEIIKANKIETKTSFTILNNLEEVLQNLKNYKKIIIFFPKKIEGRGLICQNCFYSLKCQECHSDLILEEKKIYCPFCLKEVKIDMNVCPNCQAQNSFAFKKIGAGGFFKFLKNNSHIYLIKRKTRKTLKEIAQKENFVLLGSLALISGLTPKVEAVFFFDFENFYLSSDVFIREKYLRLLHFFQEKTNNVFLVTNLRNPLVEKEIREGTIWKKILKERELLRLPPYWRIIKIIKGSRNFPQLQKEFLNLKSELKKLIPDEVIGPLLAKPFRKKKKMFLEIIIRTQRENFNLKKLLFLINFQPEKIKINPPES